MDIKLILYEARPKVSGQHQVKAYLQSCSYMKVIGA